MNKVPDQSKITFPPDVAEILAECPGYRVVGDVSELVDLACGDAENGWFEVAYDVPGKGRIVEARVCRLRNGIAANYIEPYMRRRDPDSMVIADDLPSNKPRFKDLYAKEFDELRQQTFSWLKTQELVLFPFIAGQHEKGLKAIVVAPANAGFFALGLALLQGIIPSDALPDPFLTDAVIYIAPPFRHTHFNGKQVVIHNRLDSAYEMFGYNLYPGPSAKKGVYSMLIDLGEKENWVIAHCSTVQVVTPYDNKVTIMHEGASGAGKSEMLENIHREIDGSILLGHNTTTSDDRFIVLPRTCELRPVADDMALCHPLIQKNNGKLHIMDAEDSWFVRVDHITHYGADPHLEKLTTCPVEPLLFLNIDAAPDSTALIWEHIEDSPGVPCPNPRVVLPKKNVPNVINSPVSVDIRSFGVRTPMCTKERPSYGIIGLFHILPPALAWLWRLVSPRGHNNPSIIQSQGMESEGVGSYWPFSPGRRVDQANLLLKQILDTPNTRYVLCPNQHIGAWKVGFMPNWIMREYLARRGYAKFSPKQILPARTPILGYALRSMMVEGQTIGNWFLRVEKQPEVGEEAYDEGARILLEFFHMHLTRFLEPDLLPLGKKIIDCCLSSGLLEDYCSLIVGEAVVEEN